MAKAKTTTKQNGDKKQDYVRLERRLLLLAWLNDLFGYEKIKDLLDDIEEAEEGWPAAGASYACQRLESRGSKLKLGTEQLHHYDCNIKAHLARINTRRAEPITFRYFQYLALLYTEVLLDMRFNHTALLVKKLNQFVKERNAQREKWEPACSEFKPVELTKCAYWMATGSGKTLIMHINYLQFLHYNNKHLDNIPADHTYRITEQSAFVRVARVEYRMRALQP